MDYKIETKPTLWDVMLSSGEYSDYSEDHLYIRANDREEAWFLVKKYWTLEKEMQSECLIYMDEDNKELERFAAKEKRMPRYEGDIGTDWDFDSDYGDAKRCQLFQLNVIEFKR